MAARTVPAVAFGPKGDLFAACSWDGTVRTWSLPSPLEGDVRSILLWTRALTWMRMDQSGAIQWLGPAEAREVLRLARRAAGLCGALGRE